METELFELELEPDVEALQERAAGVLPMDESFPLWGANNRLALRKGALTRRPVAAGKRHAFDLSLRCLAHPHPECRFRYVQIAVDFGHGVDGQSQDAVVEDISPGWVEGKEPVKIVTKKSGELSFEFETLKLGPSVSLEQSRECQVYFPIVRSSGKGFEEALWTFEAIENGLLHVDRDLRLIVSTPSSVAALRATFRLEAHIEKPGIVGWIPLIGNRSISFEAVDWL